MKQKKYLSAVMATVIAFTTFMQPVVAGAETITGDKAKSEVKVEQEKAVQEPTVSPDVQTSEMDKKEVTNDKTPKSTTEEQERNKGQPVDEKKTVVEPKVSTTNANPTGVALTDEQKKEQAQLASTDEVKLSQNYVETDDNGDPLRLIEAGKDYTYEVNLDVSGNVTLLSDYVVKVEVEKKYLRDWGEPLHISKPELASEVTYADEGDKKVAYIKFPQLAGGTTLSFPVQLIVEAGLTPDMYEMKPMASLMDSKLNLVKKANEISYKVTYKKPGSQKYVNGQKENGSMVWAGIDDGKGVIKEGTEVPVEFSFSTDLEFLDNYRYFKAIEVVDTLPQGAKFDPKANPDWKLSADGKSVSTTVSLNEEIGMSTNGTLANKLSKLKLSLTFPNGKVNGTYTNNVTKTYIPEKAESYEPKVESKASIDFVLDAKPVGFVFTKKRSEDATIKDSLHYKGLDYTYRIEFKNPNSMPLHNVVIDDYKRKDGTYALDKRMEFTKVQTLNGEGEKVIAYIEEDGKVTEKQITKDGKYYNFPKGTKGYRYEVAKLDGAKFFQFLAYVKISNPKDVKYDTKDASKNLFENEASFKGEIQNPTDGKVIYKAEGTDKDDIPLVEFKESISLRKEITNSRDKVLKGGELHNRLFIHGADSNLDAETVIKGGKIIDLLPKGMTVVKSSVSRQGEVIPNYKNSGQTAIVWTFEDMKAGDFAPYTSKEYPQVGFTAIANDLSEEGTNINQAYLVFDDMENMGIEYKKDAQDKFDFNENSKTDDKVVYSEDYYVYVPNKEVVLTKSVQNEELAKNKVWSTDGVFVKYGEKANYKLNIKNHLDVDVPQVTVYDVLPFKGDRAIVPNDGGEYLSRESMYSNTLTGAINAPQGFTVYYTTDKVLDNASDSMTKLNWSKTLTDYSKATGIKIVMDNGKVLKSKESVDFEFGAIVPKTGLKAEDKAYNSAAVSVNGGTSFVEGNKVYTQMDIPEYPTITKDVEGKEHHDVDKGRTYQYNVKVKIPKNIKGYETLTIKDKLDRRLTYKYATLYKGYDVYNDAKVKVDGQELQVNLTKQDIENLQGKELNLKINAYINYDAPYELIENKADLQLNNESAIESNIVTVKPNPRKAKVTIAKVSGEGLNSFESVTKKLFGTTVKEVTEGNMVINPLDVLKANEEPKLLSGATFEILDSSKNVIHTVSTDYTGTVDIRDLDMGDYFIRETVAPKGYVLDSTEYPFTVKDTGTPSLEFKYSFYNKVDPIEPKLEKNILEHMTDGTVNRVSHKDVFRGEKYKYEVGTTLL